MESLISETVYLDGTKGVIAYDVLGRVVRITRRRGIEFRYSYDARGNVIAAIITAVP